MSSILSEIYLQTIDKKIIGIIKDHDEKGHWYRYVDDGLYISQNNGIHAEQILNQINLLHKNLHFTIEKQNNDELNYLDLTIGYNKNKNGFKYKIYRKPTQTSNTIPLNSNQPPQHKMAAYNSLIYRMLKIPLSRKEMTKERNIIFQIADENGYQPKTIHRLERKIKNKLIRSHSNQNKLKENSTWTAFTYIGPKTDRLTKIFKKHNINISYKPNPKLIQKITLQNPKDDKFENGIYSIKCSDCKPNRYYIGQTKKQLSQRYEEHKKAYKNPIIYKSNLAQHAINTKHEFPPIENIKLIKKINKGLRMDIWENMNINKYNKSGLLIDEQKQINTKQDQTFNILKMTTVNPVNSNHHTDTQDLPVPQNSSAPRQKPGQPPQPVNPPHNGTRQSARLKDKANASRIADPARAALPRPEDGRTAGVRKHVRRV